ncbi:DUF134 domain-containing protein [Candidatus Uhrbacteria bacterium]|nr:DUF134 domain-containing protein [Candidatus Uhrbacteria bacterium]
MPRPKARRAVRFEPRVTYFKPSGVPLRFLETVDLTLEEAESLRLRHLEDMDQIDAAARMRTSQSTYHRILRSAYEKLADAVIRGKAIRILQKL